jgi:hypothetical protein
MIGAAFVELATTSTAQPNRRIHCGGEIISRTAAATLASGWVSRSRSKPRLEGRSP